MTKEMRVVLVVVLVLLGLGLMVGGIVASKPGAVVVGICVSGVAAQQVIALRKAAD